MRGVFSRCVVGLSRQNRRAAGTHAASSTVALSGSASRRRALPEVGRRVPGPGFAPTPTVWTTSSGCAGRPGSAARPVVMTTGGAWVIGASRAPRSSTGPGRRSRCGSPPAGPSPATRAAGPRSSLQRSREIGSYQTAWTMLHRLRSVVVRPGRDRLTGTVEVDETFIGGDEPGVRDGRARGKKVLTAIAVEVKPGGRGIGRCRMAPLTDASSASLHRFAGECRARCHGDHRRLAGLPRSGGARLHP